MRILFLTQILPYPPDAGPKVKTWHVLRFLVARGHAVTLASFVRPEELEHLDSVRSHGIELHTIPIRRSRLADVGFWLRSQVSRRPFLVERDDSAAMRALVERLVAEGKADLIHADQLSMAQFALPRSFPRPVSSVRPAGPRIVFDAHNAVWTILQRMGDSVPFPLRPILALETRRIKRYEGALVRAFDHTLAVTEIDREALVRAAGDPQARSRIRVIPIAVDTRELVPVRRKAGTQNILTLGTLHYPPNADGIRWFLNDVFPRIRERIPGACLTIVGKNPPADFLRAAAAAPGSIRVTGYVSDLDPYMQAAELVVVPVRAGGGMRVRILEAFARAMPVVTTTVGLEGIRAEPGREVLVADTDEAFAAEVVRVLHSPQLQADLAAAGRRLAETRYDWQVVLGEMAALYSGKREVGA